MPTLNMSICIGDDQESNMSRIKQKERKEKQTICSNKKN